MKKILVVDHNQDVLRRVGLVLKVYCERPATPIQPVAELCESADEAIEAIERHQPDILFLGYSFNENNTGGTGETVAQWIDGNYESTYKKPIIVATHILRSEEEAKRLFAAAKCVKHFMGIENHPQKIRKFLEDHLGK